MTSCPYACFDHVIDRNDYEQKRSSEALAAVLERKEYLLPTARNVGIREGMKTLLQAITEVENVNVFDEFAESLVSSFQSIFPASTSATES